MATLVTLPVGEYLRSSYDPDMEYVDGQLVERKVGEYFHSRLQALLTILLVSRERQQRYRAFISVSIRISPTRYRIPDVALYLYRTRCRQYRRSHIWRSRSSLATTGFPATRKRRRKSRHRQRLDRRSLTAHSFRSRQRGRTHGAESSRNDKPHRRGRFCRAICGIGRARRVMTKRRLRLYPMSHASQLGPRRTRSFRQGRRKVPEAPLRTRLT